ncbi:MAG: sulfotransferase [Acetobacteraceae bacterium]
MTDRPSRESLIQHAFTEAGRIARSDDLLRRKLDTGSAGDPLPGLSGRSAGAAPPDGRAAKEHRRRGLQLLQIGRVGEAILVLRKSVLADAADPDAHYALGVALLRDGQFAAAATSLSQAIAHKPDFAIAYRDLGNALDRQSLDVEAMEAFRHALALSPKLTGVHQRLGELCELRSDTEGAIACFRQAAAATPNTTTGRLCLARALVLERETDAAASLLRKAIALDPTSSDLHNVLAALLVSEGRVEEAVEHYDTSLRLNPRLFGSWSGIVRAKKFRAADRPIIGRIEAVLAQGPLHDQERMILHFALGKIHDDLHEYAEAMRQFDAANDIRSLSLKTDRVGPAASVDWMIERFTPDLFDQLAPFRTADETPLLIVGMPRSGTTLVEQIVTSHPAIAAGDELPFWSARGAGWEGADGDGFTVAAARAAAREYLDLLRGIGPSAARVTDKLPFNFRRLGLLHLLLPDARIIHCRRHPVDTCLSIYTIPFRAKLDFVGSKADLAFCYQQYARLMDHWRAMLPPDRFLEVDYERLIADREAESRRLIAFTGLDWDNACLQPERNNRTIRTASAWQARQPVYASSVARWRNYKPWLGELRELLPDDPC